MSIDNIGDMKECGHAEYRRIYDKYKDNLSVFSSYSGGILGLPQMSTAWGIRGMETALIASECENLEHRREDPEAWTYWKNVDLVAALDRAETAESSLAAMRQRAEEAEKGRDAAIVRAKAAEFTAHTFSVACDAHKRRAERAEEVLRYIADQHDKGMAGNWAVNQARSYFAAAQDAKPDHIPDAGKMVSDQPNPYSGELGNINLRLLARKMLWVLRYLKRQGVFHPAMDDLICEGIMHGLESDGPIQDPVPVPTERERRLESALLRCQRLADDGVDDPAGPYNVLAQISNTTTAALSPQPGGTGEEDSYEEIKRRDGDDIDNEMGCS